MQRVRIAIITAPRQNASDTLGHTVHTMRIEDPIAKQAIYGRFVDGTQVPASEETFDHTMLRTPEELAFLKADKYFGSDNLARAMRWASQDADIAVVSEDDMIVRSMWLTHAIELLAAASQRVSKPVLCMSHGCFGTYTLGSVVLSTERETLYSWGSKSIPNGMSPVVMDASTAGILAYAIGSEALRRVEPDVSMLVACRDRGLATGMFVDPCMAMHMDIGSTYMPGRDWIRAATKRFGI